MEVNYGIFMNWCELLRGSCCWQAKTCLELAHHKKNSPPTWRFDTRAMGLLGLHTILQHRILQNSCTLTAWIWINLRFERKSKHTKNLWKGMTAMAWDLRTVVWVAAQTSMCRPLLKKNSPNCGICLGHTSPSDCGWSWPDYHMTWGSLFPLVGHLPYACILIAKYNV